MKKIWVLFFQKVLGKNVLAGGGGDGGLIVKKTRLGWGDFGKSGRGVISEIVLYYDISHIIVISSKVDNFLK